jgi:hypothetical protein
MNILGYEYKLVYDFPVDVIDANGRINTATKTIHIANDLDDQETLSVILHEIIEAIDHHLELELNHKTISCLETGIYQTLTSNGVDLSSLKGVYNEE